MTKEEKEQLVEKVADLCLRDVLKREDSIGIMRICKEACDRRIKEIERNFGTTGSVQ